MESVRECDALPYLRLKQSMSPSDCNAVLKDDTRLEVLMYKNQPVVEVDNQFFHAEAVSGFDRFELKPVAAAPPEPVQLADNWVEPVDVNPSGQHLRLQLQRNSSAIYRRNIIRQKCGHLLVTEYLGVGESDSTTRYWNCRCSLTGKYVTATQADLTVGAVTCCSNAKKPAETIVFRGAQLA